MLSAAMNYSIVTLSRSEGSLATGRRLIGHRLPFHPPNEK
jgi:hypothetical protein